VEEGKSFGELIKELRTQKGWSQKELARILQISKGHISRLERNLVDPRLNTILKLAKISEDQGDLKITKLGLFCFDHQKPRKAFKGISTAQQWVFAGIASVIIGVAIFLLPTLFK
jgi:transcriptional regulator with XRE-family HTH domain